MQRLAVLSKHFGNAGLSQSESVSRQPTSSEERRPIVADRAEYERLYQRSLDDPQGFWADMASNFYWKKKWEPSHFSFNFDTRKGPVFAEWFKGGSTNISYNCLDRWVAQGRGNQLCFIWEGNDYGHERAMTYQQVLDEVCRVANWLKGQGIRKGDAVALYMPMTCELPIAMLACARIGAVHSVIFGGFSADSLAQRVLDCKSRVVITASAVMRGTKRVPLKSIVDDALGIAAREGFYASRVLVYEKSALLREQTPMLAGRDVWWRDEIPTRPEYCEVEWMDAEDPMFLLYTSGSTGRPKGVLHTCGGYMVGAGVTTRYIFDLQPGDIYWCTADCGWITGHTYVVYGALLNGATSILFGSTPNHPDAGRCWRMIEKYRVRVFYTAPTLLRSLMQYGDDWPRRFDRSSLVLLGSVGEPIDEHAWRWFTEVVGDSRCPIMDTWWQTETGSIMISPMPGTACNGAAWPLKHSSATLPFFGVKPIILNEKGEEQQGVCEGVLAVNQPWPSMARTLYGEHQRFEEVYFGPFKGYYFTGDGCRRDEQGYYTITGRVDDVINVSGHRVGTAEVESALTELPECAEAAVVGIDHPIKGQAIYAYVTMLKGTPEDDSTRSKLKDCVRRSIGSFAVPDTIHWASTGLPKTRSGKIMRRILRKIATQELGQLGDTSTLAEPGVVDDLIKMHGK